MGGYANALANSLITLFMVTAGRSNILSNTTKDSWMSDENFTSLIEASFNVPQCANVFVCDKTPGAERIFKEFISVYPFEYALNDTIHGCDNFLLAATSDESAQNTVLRLPTIRSTTEILIVLDTDIRDQRRKSIVLHTFSYLRSNVNVVARNGLWTLSDNYLENRVFTKVTRFEDMKHKKGIVNFGGRLIQATTFYNPPMCFLKTATNRSIGGIEAEYFIAEDESERDGVELILFMLIADRLNFTWTIRKPAGEHRFGRRNGSRWEDGVIGQMYNNETDFAFGGIRLSLDIYEFTTLTTPWKQIDIAFLVPRPKPHASFWALATPLSPEVWAMTVAMVIAQSAAIYARAWINPHIPKRFRSFAKTWTEMVGRLVGSSAPRKMQSLRMQFQLWHFIGILIVTAYSSSLAAKLARRDYDKRIDTIRDFIKANLTWGREGPPPPFATYFDLSDRYARQMPRHYENETSEAERHEKILKGKYAIIGNLVSSAFFPQSTIRDKDLKNYRLMKQPILSVYITFAIIPWLAESVDQVMLWMQEGGLVEYHLEDVLYRRMTLELRDVLIEHDINTGEATVLQLTPLGAGFSFYLIGLLISTIVFCLELRTAKKSRSICEMFRDIRRNRETWRAKELNAKRSRLALTKIKSLEGDYDCSSEKSLRIRVISRPVRVKPIHIKYTN